MLRSAEYAGRFATRGEDGVRLARALLPDLIMLDLTLPDTDGWSVLAELPRDPATAAIPVLIISTQDARSEARRAGAAAFVEKPIDRAALLELTRGEVERGRQPRHRT